MIYMDNLSKVYRTENVETLALNKINLKVDKGEFIAIMGPSGCGKSTLLNMLGMLDTPTKGHYVFNGIDVSQLSEQKLAQQRKGNIGFIFQSFNLIDELNVTENVELPLLYLGISKAERQQRVTAILAQMNISHRAKHYPKQLSGGQQQRVAIARALINNPLVILADEPTGNLDSKNGDDVMELLQALNKSGTTILMVTHSAYHADFANRIVHLFDSEIVLQNHQIDN